MFEVKNSNKLDSQVYRDSLIIREDVFVKEQGVSIEIEIEGEEGPKYYCGYADGENRRWWSLAYSKSSNLKR